MHAISRCRPAQAVLAFFAPFPFVVLVVAHALASGNVICSLERISDVFRFPILPLAEGRRLSVFGGDTCRTCCIAPPMEAHSHWFLLLTSHADTQKPSEQDAGTNDHQRGLWGNIRHFDWWSWFSLGVRKTDMIAAFFSCPEAMRAGHADWSVIRSHFSHCSASVTGNARLQGHQQAGYF